MRRPAAQGRQDANQPDIVSGLLYMGATVQVLSAVGQGCPDLMIGWKGQNYLIEIKNPEKPKGDQRLTPDQIKWHGFWRGQKAVARTIEDAIAIINGATGYDK